MQHRERLKPGCGGGGGTLGQRLGDAAAVLLAHWVNGSAGRGDFGLDREPVALEGGEAHAVTAAMPASGVAPNHGRLGLGLQRLAAVAQLGQRGLGGDVRGGRVDFGGDCGRGAGGSSGALPGRRVKAKTGAFFIGAIIARPALACGVTP